MNNAPKKENQSKQDLYVTLIVVLMMIAVIVAISVSLAKSTKKIEEASRDTKDLESVAQTVPKEDDDVPTIETEDVLLKDDETKPPETEEAETEKTDSPVTQKAEAEVIPNFILPVQGELMKGCSLEIPVFSLTMEDYRTHAGIDLYCNPGSDVAAAAKGTIKEIWNDPMMGTCISIEHAGGSVTVYKNLCEDIPDGIEAGKPVEAGQIIATAGDTALLELCEDSHLHFELYIGEKAVDPCEYIKMKNEE